MSAFINGILFGLLLSILIGPVFFALIQTSIEKGFRCGVLLAVGISLSDALYIAICYIGFTRFFELEHFKESLAMIGGLIMLLFGISALFKPVSNQPALMLNGDTGTFRHVIKGFLLNAVNPFVILFWIGVIIKVTVNEPYQEFQVILFFLATILTVFLADIGKAYLAHRLSAYLTSNLIAILNRVVGIALIGSGARLIYFAFKGM